MYDFPISTPCNDSDPKHSDTHCGVISRWNWGHGLSPGKKKRKSRVREMSQRWSEAICLCVIWVGWGRCYLLPTSPHWPLTNQLTRMPGRRLSDSRWLPSHCLGTDSRQLARSLWGWCVWLECVHVCSWEGLIREQTEMLRKRHTGFKKINNPVVYLLCK